ncbi:hypothetical protein JCM11641_008036 [Rhodosporidiobolus odoratus]
MDTVDPAFLPLPFSSCSPSGAPPLLLKLLYRPDKKALSVLATDLVSVYLEDLNCRQLQARLADALADEGGEDSQSQSIGIGEEGEKLLGDNLETLLTAVNTGSARAELVEAGFEYHLSISTGRFTFRFRTTSLEQQSAPVIAAHLIRPLLAVSASLLALLQPDGGDKDGLLDRVSASVDDSAKVCGEHEGEGARLFSESGGSGLVARWLQRGLDWKASELQPVTLSRPQPCLSRPRPPSQVPSRSPTKRKPTASPSAASPPPRKQFTQPSPSPSRPFPSLAQRMLNHQSSDKGEKVDWESQPVVNSSRARRSTIPPNSTAENPDPVDPALQDRTIEEEDEPATEDENDLPSGFSLPRAQQLSQTPALGAGDNDSLSLAPGLYGTGSFRSPSALPSQSQLSFPEPTPTPTPRVQAGEDDEPADDEAMEEEDPEEKKRRAKEAKKREKEVEAEEELARRKARLSKLAKTGGGGAKKKAVKKL